MPTLISRGTAAARAFGLTGASSGQLYTQTFTSNGTFTPLFGVTNVVTIVGRGGSSTSDFQTTFPFDYARVYIEQDPGGSGGASLLPIYANEAAYNLTSDADTCNSGGFQTIYHDYGGSGYQTYTVYPDNTYNFTSSTKYPFTSYMVAGTWSVQGYGLPTPPSGTFFTYSTTPTGFWHLTGDYIAAGSAGANSSGLGYTFPGASQVGSYPTATGQAATPVTYNNVAVTPGTGYPIVVGAGGSVSISFIIP